MNINTIVFDFGNVLAFFDHRKAAEQLAVYSPLSVEEIHDLFEDSQLEDDFESGRISTTVFRKLVRQRCRVSCTDEQLDEAIGDMFTRNDEVCELVPALKPRHRLLLLSNTNDVHSRHFRRKFADTLRHFDALVLSHEVRLRKPCRDIYTHCHTLAHCAPSQCLFIDDLPVNIEGARACGWQGIVYRPGLDLRRELRKRGIELVVDSRSQFT